MYYEKINPEEINQQFLQESQYRKLVWPIIYEDENWVQISSFLPQVKDYYWVSNYGRIYSAAVGYCIIPCITNGYQRIALQLKDSRSINPEKRKEIFIGVHRLVCMAFHGMPSDDSYQPNHLDSLRINNHSENLEWVTPKENIEYAFKYGNRKVGEDSNRSVYTENQVRQICELMESGIYDLEEICQRVFGEGKLDKYKTLIYNIRNRMFWTSISCNYNFEPSPKKDVFTDIEINKICQYLEDHPNALTPEIAMNALNIDMHLMNKKDSKKMANILQNIKNRKTHTDISNKYNF